MNRPKSPLAPRSTAQILNKYYTNADVAKYYVELFKGFIPKDSIIVDPSAGAGAFMAHDPEIIGFDIAPQGPNIVQADFLKLNIEEYLVADELERVAILTNPPFNSEGKRNDLAIEFLNKSLNLASYVGFIVPIGFRRFSYQSKISPWAELVFDQNLASEESFTLEGKASKQKCCFQVWTTHDLRHKSKPANEHRDFVIYVHNGTDSTRHYFDVDWDMAIPRNGLRSSQHIVYNKARINRGKQYLFVKAVSPAVLEALKQIDWTTLAQDISTGPPSLGQHDIVRAYTAHQRQERIAHKRASGMFGRDDLTIKHRYRDPFYKVRDMDGAHWHHPPVRKWAA